MSELRLPQDRGAALRGQDSGDYRSDARRGRHPRRLGRPLCDGTDAGGICGLMPGLAMADSLQRVFKLRRQGEAQESFRLFERLLPQIEFSLQNMELFIYCEKRLLQERGLLQTSV